VYNDINLIFSKLTMINMHHDKSQIKMYDIKNDKVLIVLLY